MLANPFTYGNPISKAARFIGREREVDQVFSRLSNPEAESSSLVGERRVGKTSLLHHLKNPDVRRKYHLDSEKYIFIYSDLQMIGPETTPTRLSQRLLGQLAQHSRNTEVQQKVDELANADFIDNFALADLFDVVDKNDLRIVFLLDEFENVTRNPNFGPEFFYGLRSLAIQHNLTLITSSVSELIDLTHSEVIRSSPFFNIFANINLRIFSPSEARHLVASYLEGTDVLFTEQELDLIFRLAGRHPFFLQAACHFLFDAYIKGMNPSDREKFTIKEFREEATPHMEDYWRSSPDSEKIVLTALALLEVQGKAGKNAFKMEQLQELYARSDQTLSRLHKRGLLVEKDGSYAILNSVYRDWIIDEIFDKMSDQVSYGDWLKSNQSLMDRLSSKAKNEISEVLPKISPNYRELIISWISDPRNLITVASLLRSALT